MQEHQSDAELGQAGDIGSRLRHRRIAKELSLDEVSAELRISAAYLNALEFNDLSAIPNTTFARGYLKTYCRYLGVALPTSTVSEAPPIPDAPAKLSMAQPLNRQTRASDPLVKGVSLVIVVATLLTTLFWWRSQQENEVAGSAPNAAEMVAVDTAEGTVVVSTESATSSLGPNLNDLQQQAALENTSDEKLVTTTMPEALDVAMQELDQGSMQKLSKETLPDVAMIVAFSDTSWIEVRNATNEILFTGIKKAGDQLALDEEALLSVVIGNAASVDLSYNGVKVDLQPFTDERNVAKLKLGL